MPDPMQTTPVCRALPRGERQAVDGWLRSGRMWGHAALSRLIGGRAAVEWMLDSALSSSNGRDAQRAFAVPLPYALRSFGDALCLQLPTALLERRLVDWVQFGGRVSYVGEHFVGLGGWESISFPFARTGVMREAEELARLDLQFKASRMYHAYRKRMEEGSPIRRNKIFLSSEALLDAYFERFVNLFRSVREHGVLPLRHARQVASDLSAASDVRRYGTEAGERDIGVAIGPEGEIYALPGGKHRAAIATVLGMATVPVEARMVHVEWIRAMRRRHGGGAFEAVRCGILEMHGDMAVIEEGLA